MKIKIKFETPDKKFCEKIKELYNLGPDPFFRDLMKGDLEVEGKLIIREDAFKIGHEKYNIQFIRGFSEYHPFLYTADIEIEDTTPNESLEFISWIDELFRKYKKKTPSMQSLCKDPYTFSIYKDNIIDGYSIRRFGEE